MFHMNKSLKIVLAVEPVDLRKSFSGLYEIARNELGMFPKKTHGSSFPAAIERESKSIYAAAERVSL